LTRHSRCKSAKEVSTIATTYDVPFRNTENQIFRIANLELVHRFRVSNHIRRLDRVCVSRYERRDGRQASVRARHSAAPFGDARPARDRPRRTTGPPGRQQHSGALDAPRRLASRLCYRPQLRQFLPTNRHIDRSPRCCHGMLRRQYAPSHPYHILRLAGNSPQPIEIKE
jgi:hypothetical protein